MRRLLILPLPPSLSTRVKVELAEEEALQSNPSAAKSSNLVGNPPKLE